MKTTPSLDTFGSLAPEDGFGPGRAVIPGLGMLLIRLGLLALLGFGASRSGLGMRAADQFGNTSPAVLIPAGKG